MTAALGHFRIGLATGAIAVAATWAVIGEYSPLDGAFRAPVYYLTLLINLPGMVLGMVASGPQFKSTDPVFYLGMAIQWICVGTAASWLWARLRPTGATSDA
jgi:hypothetical protein